MSFEGMDVDQLQGLAKQIGSDAQALYNLVTDVSAVAGGLTLFWHGPMAATFQQEWQSKNRPALLAAYNTLTNLHTHLVNNVNQQTSASAAEGGWTLDRLAGDARTLWDKWEDLEGKWISPVETPVGTLHDLAGKEYERGTEEFEEYSKTWNKLIKLDRDSDFLKYHESPVLRYVHDAVHDSSMLRYVHDSEVADRVLAHTRVVELIPVIGGIIALPDAIVNTGEAVVDLKDHRYNSAIMHAGNVAEDEGSVLGLVGGGATRLLAEDYELGKADIDGTAPSLSAEQVGEQALRLTLNAFFG